MLSRTLLLALLCALGPLAAARVRAQPGRPAPGPAIRPETIDATVERLLAAHGGMWSARAAAGVRQVAERWWREDGDEAAFADFCVGSFETDAVRLQGIFDRPPAAGRSPRGCGCSATGACATRSARSTPTATASPGSG